MRNNRMITGRKYYALDVSLVSPLNIFGKSDETDSDLLVNGNGEVFIPGTSIAGAWRDYLEQKEEDNTIFGEAKDEAGHMSRILISDLILHDVEVETRDHVKLLDEERIAASGAKFDMEIASKGHGILYFSTIEREGDQFPDEDLIRQAVQAMQKGEIRFGAKKNRGFGQVKITDVYTASFQKENAQEWLSFEEDEKDLHHYQKHAYEEWASDQTGDKYLHINIPLKLTGGISIRKYSTVPGDADFEHIHSHGVPVVPGTSWAGAIRHDAVEIMRFLCVQTGVDEKKADAFLNHWFGYVNGDDAHQSRIVIGESVLQNSVSLINMRNRIDRFDHSTEDGALFEERMNAKGNTVLSVMIHKDEGYEAAAGLIGLVLEDIEKGYVSIGGGAAIGRGVFTSDEKVPDAHALYAWLEQEASHENQ